MFSEEFHYDIKHLFDGLRNVAICVSLMAGAPYVERIFPLFDGDNWLQTTITVCYLVVIGVFYLANMIWMFAGFKKQPKNNSFHFISFIIIFVLTTVAIGSATYFEIIKNLTSI